MSPIDQQWRTTKVGEIQLVTGRPRLFELAGSARPTRKVGAGFVAYLILRVLDHFGIGAAALGIPAPDLEVLLAFVVMWCVREVSPPEVSRAWREADRKLHVPDTMLSVEGPARSALDGLSEPPISADPPPGP